MGPRERLFASRKHLDLWESLCSDRCCTGIMLVWVPISSVLVHRFVLGVYFTLLGTCRAWGDESIGVMVLASFSLPRSVLTHGSHSFVLGLSVYYFLSKLQSHEP